MGVLGEMFPGRKITDESGEDGDAQPWRLDETDLVKGVIRVRAPRPVADEHEPPREP